MSELKRGPCCIVSACLCGIACRYDGKAQPMEQLRELHQKGLIIPFCPETAGGLPTPRIPCELQGGQAVTRDGRDVTAALRAGAAEAWRLVSEYSIKLAILKEKSPSCGSSLVYDGTFSGKVVPGMGITASILKERGIHVINERMVRKMFKAGTEAGIDFFELFA